MLPQASKKAGHDDPCVVTHQPAVLLCDDRCCTGCQLLGGTDLDFGAINDAVSR